MGGVFCVKLPNRNVLVVPSVGGNNFRKTPPNCLVGLVNEVERLLSHLKSFGPSNLFTFERENEKCLSSLDLIAYVQRTDRGDPETSINSNKTHTQRQIPHFRLVPSYLPYFEVLRNKVLVNA